MPSAPLRSQLHVDQLLSNVAVKYKNERFIHDKVFQQVPVKKTSDLYRTYNRNWVIPETNRAIGGLAKEHLFEIGNSNYSLEKHALKSYVADTAADNYDITDLRADVTMELVEKIMMRKEAQCAANFATTTSWSLGSSLGGDDSWLTSAAAPIVLFDTAASAVVSNSGVQPNYAIIPRASYLQLKNHTTLVDRVKYTSREMSPGIVGALLGVGEILIPDMYYDSGLYGASAASGAITGIWKDDFAFLGYKPGAPGFYQLASGYMFQKAKPMVRRWREEEREGDAIEVDVEFQFKIVASLTGYYINDTI
jgi:hypothetical protein